MACYRPELRRQHRYPLQHELCGMHTDAPHTFNGYIALQGSIFLRLRCSLELCKSFLTLILQIYFLQCLLNGSRACLSIKLLLTAQHSLQLLLWQLKQACNGLLHNRVKHRLIELDIAPAVPIKSEYICTE